MELAFGHSRSPCSTSYRSNVSPYVTLGSRRRHASISQPGTLREIRRGRIGKPFKNLSSLHAFTGLPFSIRVCTDLPSKSGLDHIRSARSTALTPTLIATVATGTPLGICTMLNKLSKPSKGLALTGTPITGSVVLSFSNHAVRWRETERRRGEYRWRQQAASHLAETG